MGAVLVAAQDPPSLEVDQDMEVAESKHKGGGYRGLGGYGGGKGISRGKGYGSQYLIFK